MENISKIKVHGKAMNRTVLGIVNAYLVMNPKTTAEQLREVFSTAKFTKGKWFENNKDKNTWAAEGFFHEIVIQNGVRKWASTGAKVEVTTIQFEQEDEIIHTADGKMLAMESIWKQEDYQEVVEYAKQFGIEVASLERTTKIGERGGFTLEYLNGYEPVVEAEPAPEPVVEEKKEEVHEEPVEEPKEEEQKCCSFLCLLLWILVGLMAIFLAYQLFTKEGVHTPINTDGPVVNEEAVVDDELPDVLPIDSLVADTAAVDSSMTDSIAPDTELTEMPVMVAKETVEAVKTIQKKFNAAKFVKGKTDLSDETKAVLDELADVLKQNPNAKMKVVGYASPEGDEKYNQYLSEKRAKAVVNYLVSKGVSSKQLRSEGKGVSDQISDNPDENRRTEFVWE